jgi:hypothetical protein
MEVPMKTAGRYLSALALSLLLLYGGCSDDSCECPVCPGMPSPTLDNLWPNEDGNTWSYDWVLRVWDTDPFVFYEDSGDVPAVPDFDFVEELLGDESVGADADTGFGIFRLEFDGTDSTSSGAPGQNLLEKVFYEMDFDIIMVSFEEVFLSRLAKARPDLQSIVAAHITKEESYANRTSQAVEIANLPTLLHGGIWEKVDEYIGTYGDLDTDLAWKFLESDISTGHEFSFQLVPSIASDVFLHCKVLGQGTVETSYGTYKKAVECLYIIDYGLSSTETIDGTRYWRVYEYGTITYAPTVGPVLSYERRLIDTSAPDGPGHGDSTLELIGAGEE